MAGGISINEAITLFGSVGATSTRQVRLALSNLGIFTGPKLVRRRPDEKAPVNGMLKICFERQVSAVKVRKWSHWVLMKDGVLHDPGFPQSGVTSSDGRFTSYLLFHPKQSSKE
jgi:hypothetical protein